ncbi:transmembrane 9 superfamily member 3 [Paragonimus westermani]|uniref:Transmembrane 9 superfamily member n=1 Tax=Paragonimus westermani TaxID=34504 RepID=A0A5J4NS72_9TREM|nr:transmembrane 9 superfamily member 3 [Paragonimus westermani]
MRTIYSLVAVFISLVRCDEHNHVYADGEQVVLWMNTIGPYRNRQETYPYFSLPFCRGPKESIEHAHETLGEALLGIELQYSGIDIRFKVDISKTTICEIAVTESDYEKLRGATANQYWYQMYLDDLPIWSVVGEVSTSNEPFIWTHKQLDIGYNGNQIVKVTLINSELVALKVGTPVTFTYSVKWHSLPVPFERRYDDYLDFQFFQHRIHWFSIFNSFMMVLFLIALVFMILLRTLRRDYARYNKEEGLSDLDRELGDEYGWKQVHGDVFRQPANPCLLASLVGSGAHLAVVAFIALLLALTNHLYTERGGFISIAIFVFAATAPINGLVGGSLYSQLSGKRWIRQFLLGATLLPILVCSVAFFVNLIAMYYHTSRAIPFLTMLAVAAIVLFVIIPLNLVGTVLGRNLCGHTEYPCRVNAVPKPIPEKKWFMEPGFLILLAGLLPFGSIFIELYFIFTSFWAYKIYFVFGFTILVLLLLMTVTSSVTAVGTYFLLNSEDYRWQWTSFLSGASISLYAYIYSAYFFLFKTKMSGLFQTTFFFGYMALFCICLGVLCGAIGYLAASRFVRKIYSTVKVD